ncbi:MAG: tyrosinase family protein [Amaricoccus sp.]
MRLSLRLALACVLILACLANFGARPASAQAVRKSVNDLTPAELMTFRRGVAQMMAWNSAPRGGANFRRSWIFWANMHNHFGSDCSGPVSGNNMNGVQLWTASNAKETQTWCECQHHNEDFLVWHRMYIWFFERVMQQASGDPNFRLPYWDYSSDGRLPQAFRDQTYVNQNGQTVANPLYVSGRKPALNNGSQSLQSAVTSSANAMAANNEATFRTRLESTPHGSVHCGLSAGGCPNGLMGAPASAALDPIFYVHHSNIDRLYECWLQVNPSTRLPSSSTVLNTRFSFIGANGSVQTRRVRDMLTTSQLGYTYTSGGGCPYASTSSAVVAAAEAKSSTAPAAAAASASSSGAVTTLGSGTTQVPLQVESTPAAAAARSAAPSSAAGARTAASVPATVTIMDVQAKGAPGTMFNVYLVNDKGSRVQIGVLSFFGFGEGSSTNGGPGMQGMHHAMPEQPSQTLDFDVTEAVKTLGLTPGAKPKLAFEPTTGATDSTPAAAAKTMRADTPVTFRGARLSFGS